MSVGAFEATVEFGFDFHKNSCELTVFLWLTFSYYLSYALQAESSYF